LLAKEEEVWLLLREKVEYEETSFPNDFETRLRMLRSEEAAKIWRILSVVSSVSSVITDLG
jgi:hypothetical protein